MLTINLNILEIQADSHSVSVSESVLLSVSLPISLQFLDVLWKMSARCVPPYTNFSTVVFSLSHVYWMWYSWLVGEHPNKIWWQRQNIQPCLRRFLQNHLFPPSQVQILSWSPCSKKSRTYSFLMVGHPYGTRD